MFYARNYHIIHWVTHWIKIHGYGVIAGLFAVGIIGLPLPNEWILAYLGHLIYKGELLPIPTVTAAVLGSVCGATFNYALGRTLGLYLVKKFGRFVRLTPEKMDKMHEWFEHSGRWGLLFGYFLPGVRHLTVFAAGTSKMTFTEFTFFGYGGAFIWSSTFIFLGYFFEEQWSKQTKNIHHILGIGSLAAIVLFAFYLLWKKRKQKNAQ